jgi:hypothetical protein
MVTNQTDATKTPDSPMERVCRLVFDSGRIIARANPQDAESGLAALAALKEILTWLRPLGCPEAVALVQRERQDFEKRLIGDREKID